MELSGVTGSPCTVQDITHRDRAAILLLNANLLGLHLSFSHPDYTVGSGITPDQPSANGRQVTDFASSAGQIGPYTSCITAGRELHPALKDCFRYYLDVSTLMPKNQLFFVPFCHILTFNKLRNNKKPLPLRRYGFCLEAHFHIHRIILHIRKTPARHML